MKNFKTLITILTISIASILPASANANVDPDNPQTVHTALRTQIVKLLGNHYNIFEGQDLNAEVSILINNNSELVIVDVKTNSANIANFIKDKLNYKKVAIRGIAKGSLFRMPLKMNSSN